MTFWIVVGVVVLVLLAMGYRYDRRHRRLGGSAPDTATSGRARIEGEEKSRRWNAGGGMPSNGQ